MIQFGSMLRSVGVKTFFKWEQHRTPTEEIVGLFCQYLLKPWDLFQKKAGGRGCEERQGEIEGMKCSVLHQLRVISYIRL